MANYVCMLRLRKGTNTRPYCGWTTLVYKKIKTLCVELFCVIICVLHPSLNPLSFGRVYVACPAYYVHCYTLCGNTGLKDVLLADLSL